MDNGILKFAVCGESTDIPAVCLFSVDEHRYFLAMRECGQPPAGFEYYSLRELRDKCCAGSELFAAFTAFHLWKWYTDNKFCGKCGGVLDLKGDERALVCPVCGNIIYPRINPAVIVGVISNDKLLITRYNKGYAHNALVAGFTEIGETLEQTAEREVMEETGIKVTDIRYYGSQPWGMAQDILAGFFCTADGEPEIHFDESELKYAEWVSRDELVLQPNDLSLTNEMMAAFKYNRLGMRPPFRSLLEETSNTRELGGHCAADGKITASCRLWRSDVPAVYSAADAEKLRNNGFGVLIDMRTDEEIRDKKCAYDNEDLDFEYFHFRITEGSKPPATFEEVPDGYMKTAASSSMAKVLRTIAAAEKNVMFFCTAGKDRTGVLTAIILLACGIDRQTVIWDYSLSREYNGKKLKKYLEEHPGIDRRTVLADERSMERFIEMFFEEYGSIEKYFERMGLSADDLRRIRGKLLD